MTISERTFDLVEAMRLSRDGVLQSEIAVMLGVDKSTISRAFKNANFVAGPLTPGSPASAAQIPETFGEMRDLAIAEVWKNFKTLKGTAQIQAMNAIIQLARQEPDGGGEAEPEPLIADVVSGVASLSDERKLAILVVEQARLHVEIAAIDDVLAGLEVAA